MQTERSLSRRDILFGPLRSQDRPRLQVADRCLSLSSVACRACEDVCAVRAIRFRPRLGGIDLISVDAAACTGCGDCAPMCPINALSLEGPSPHG
ncbi:MAG: 4Fe-4S dicluster domain-containing protein [Geminicoccaceae bacterium]